MSLKYSPYTKRLRFAERKALGERAWPAINWGGEGKPLKVLVINTARKRRGRNGEGGGGPHEGEKKGDPKLGTLFFSCPMPVKGGTQ